MISTMRISAVALITAGTLLCSVTELSAQQVRWRASGSFPAGHSTSIAMETFKKEVARLSNNTIQVDLFSNNTLGGGFEQVDQIRTGQIQMAWAGLPFYDKLSPDLGAAVLPFGAATANQPRPAMSDHQRSLGASAVLSDMASQKSRAESRSRLRLS